MTRSFKYVGPYDEVEVNGVGLVKQGETVQVEDTEVSGGLEGQEIWEHVPDPQRSRAAKKAAATRSDSDDSQEG